MRKQRCEECEYLKSRFGKDWILDQWKDYYIKEKKADIVKFTHQCMAKTLRCYKQELYLSRIDKDKNVAEYKKEATRCEQKKK